MAKKKANKDYTAGNGKRWLIAFGVLALIAIIIVIIVISIPPNINSAMQLLNKSSTTSFMMSETDKKSFDDFELKVKSSQKVNSYITLMPTEMADVQNLSITLSEVLEFYNDYIVFSNNNNAFKKNYKSIKNGLNDAMKNQKELNNILTETNKLSEQSPTYLQNAWMDFRKEYLNWLENYQIAIDALNNTYQEGMGTSLKNNLASKLILNTVSDYIDVIVDDFQNMIDEDAKTPNPSSYQYLSGGKIKAFDNFVNKFVNDKTDIQDYYFKNSLREKYQKINNYFELYSEPDMKNAISSIKLPSGIPTVTKYYEGIEDTEGVYNSVKIFLIGGV